MSGWLLMCSVHVSITALPPVHSKSPSTAQSILYSFLFVGFCVAVNSGSLFFVGFCMCRLHRVETPVRVPNVVIVTPWGAGGDELTKSGKLPTLVFNFAGSVLRTARWRVPGHDTANSNGGTPFLVFTPSHCVQRRTMMARWGVSTDCHASAPLKPPSLGCRQVL